MLIVVVEQESCVWVFFAIGSSCGSSCASASVCYGVSVIGFQRRYATLHNCGRRTVLHLGAPEKKIQCHLSWFSILQVVSKVPSPPYELASPGKTT